jgi:hypothetical protein
LGIPKPYKTTQPSTYQKRGYTRKSINPFRPTLSQHANHIKSESQITKGRNYYQ